MATDARGHTVPASTDAPKRADLTTLSLSVKDVLVAASVSDRATKISALTTAGVGPSTSNPVFVWRQDAAASQMLEVTTDGSTFNAIRTLDNPIVVNFSTQTTDASGFITVTHGAGFTPSNAMYINRQPASSSAAFWGWDTSGGTTIRIRLQNASAGGPLVSLACGNFALVLWR